MNQLDLRWEMKFLELKKFKKKYGHCDVPLLTIKRYKSLGRWCVCQRLLRKFEPGHFDDDRLRKLDKLGFCWSIPDRAFEKSFARLKRYHQKHGHCNVRKNEDMILYKWCSKLRQEYKKGEKRLTKERQERLNKLGFEWKSPFFKKRKDGWLSRYKELRDYVKTHGHRFPHSSKSRYIHLTYWAHNLRVAKKAGKLSDEKIKMLDKIGFIWEVHDELWEKRFNDLKQYKARFGHCNVGAGKSDKEYKSLLYWVAYQRERYHNKEKPLEPDRVRRLNEIGFRW